VPWRREIAETAMCTDAVAFAAARSMIEGDMQFVRRRSKEHTCYTYPLHLIDCPLDRELEIINAWKAL